MRRRLIVLLAIAGLLAVSGIAAAATEEDEDDTIFNFGYDEEWGVLLWNLTPNDGLYDCTLANGALTTTYGLSGDGLVYVDGLTNGSDAVSFPQRPQEDLAEGLVEAEGPVDYTGADGECGVSGGAVAGPAGQINHGMFMRLFNSMFAGRGRGCVNRYLAQSDLGKGDQQVRVPDVDPDAPILADGLTGSVEFETVIANCIHEKTDEATGQERAAEKKAENAERKAARQEAKADKEAGKSGSAPGRDK